MKAIWMFIVYIYKVKKGFQWCKHHYSFPTISLFFFCGSSMWKQASVSVLAFSETTGWEMHLKEMTFKWLISDVVYLLWWWLWDHFLSHVWFAHWQKEDMNVWYNVISVKMQLVRALWLQSSFFLSLIHVFYWPHSVRCEANLSVWIVK